MNANDYVAVGLPVPLSYTGKPGCIGVSDANGNPVLGTGPGTGSASGALQLDITSWVTPTGVPHGASAAAGVFGMACTAGTTLSLVTEVANNNTKTDVALFEMLVPVGYVAGNPLNITVNAGYTIGSGVLSASTLTLNSYIISKDGTQSANLVTTSAATITGTNTDYSFAITSTNIAAGSRLLIKATIVLTETSGHNVTANINSARVN